MKARGHSEKRNHKAFVRVKQKNTLKDSATCKETLLMRQKVERKLRWNFLPQLSKILNGVSW